MAARATVRATPRLPTLSAPCRRSPVAMAVATALSGAAMMQAAPLLAAATAEAGSSELMAEIVVTARKRTENLQDVPLSIEVLTRKDLEHLAITQFEDYATHIPSISFISAGPGTQLFVMRGVSDGSNSNYANSSATAFLVDDMSMSYYGVTPDLHFYDYERIEVLNGPQGTTFGASAMAGAIRFITNKPDVTAFSAGVDFDGGRIDGGGNNWTYEGFVNLPLIEGRTAVRMSAFSSYHGGFINNLLTSRTWLNGTTSNNAAWAGSDYNTQNVIGGRFAVKQVITDAWQATLTYNYQRQLAKGAWDEDVNRYGTRNVARFGPEFHSNYVKSLDFHVDGDVGIADLVYAGTYWSQPLRQVNEYSEYMQYATTSSGLTPPALQGVLCLHDPVSSGGALPYTGCNPVLQYYDYRNRVDRWSHEIRLLSKPGGRFHWLGGVYYEKTINKYGNYYHMPGLRTDGDAFKGLVAYYAPYYTKPATPIPGDWYSYDARSDYWQTSEFANLSFDLTNRWSIEGGAVHFRSYFTSSSYGGFWYVPQSPTYSKGGTPSKWDFKAGLNFKAADNLLLYANFAQGFREGGVNNGYPPPCYARGIPHEYKSDTLNNFEIGWKSTLFGGHLTWNGALYYMPWKDFQTLLFDTSICSSSSFSANIGDAKVYGAESNIDWRPNESWTVQAAVSYSDSHIISNKFSFPVPVGERLPYVPYFSYSWSARYEAPLSNSLKAYWQYDIAHKGDMYNDLRSQSSKGFPRVLQPPYEVMNVRVGINPSGAKWLAELYISNLWNKDAVIYTNTGNFDFRQTVNEPRVFGMRLNYRWGKGE
jgi:iron complex outermembrane receptor protein